MVPSIDLATEHPLISVAVAKHRFLSLFLFWRSHTRSGRSIDAMFYVKHLTHAHFVRGRTDRHIIGASRSEPHTTEFYAFLGILYIIIIIIYYILSIRTTSDKVRMRQMFHVKTWRRCSAHYVYAFAKKEKASEIDASPQLPISMGVQSLERLRLPWSVPLDRSRLPRSAIMAVQVQSTDVFLCYQRLRVSCALCNNFQPARPRQTTERRLAPLYVEHA